MRPRPRQRTRFVPTLEGLPTLRPPGGVGPTTMDDPSNHPPAEGHSLPPSDPFGQAIVEIDHSWEQLQAEFPDCDPYAFVPVGPTSVAPADPYN